MWVVCGANAFNSKVVMAAQVALLAKADKGTAAALDATALELAQAEVAAAAAKERRGGKNDDTMSGYDLAAAAKFVHLKDSLKGWSAFNTKGKRAAYLATLVPVWTERVLCDAPAVPPIAAAAAAPLPAAAAAVPPPPAAAAVPDLPPRIVVDFPSMTPAERRAHLAALVSAMEGDE